MTILGLTESGKEILRETSHVLRDGNLGSPLILIVLLGVVVMLTTAYYGWRWQRRMEEYVSSPQLLKMLGDSIGLAPIHYRVLRKLARAAKLEPASALISPQLLTQLVHRGEQAGLHLSSEETLRIGQILDTVAAAANKSASLDCGL